MTELLKRLSDVETSLSIQNSLLAAAPHPKVRAAIYDRIAELQQERVDILTEMEARR